MGKPSSDSFEKLGDMEDEVKGYENTEKTEDAIQHENPEEDEEENPNEEKEEKG